MNIRLLKDEIEEVGRDQIMWSLLGYGKRLGFLFCVMESHWKVTCSDLYFNLATA